MANKMLIDATHPEETRVVVLRGNRVEEFDFEAASRRQLRGNIYLAKVTRVEPSLQAAFIDYGGNRHGFLAFSEIHPDYYQIPIADRQALIEEEERAHLAAEAEADRRAAARSTGRSQPASQQKGRGNRVASAPIADVPTEAERTAEERTPGVQPEPGAEAVASPSGAVPSSEENPASPTETGVVPDNGANASTASHLPEGDGETGSISAAEGFGASEVEPAGELVKEAASAGEPVDSAGTPPDEAANMVSAGLSLPAEDIRAEEGIEGDASAAREVSSDEASDAARESIASDARSETEDQSVPAHARTVDTDDEDDADDATAGDASRVKSGNNLNGTGEDEEDDDDEEDEDDDEEDDDDDDDEGDEEDDEDDDGEDEAAEVEETVESVGGADALEEAQERTPYVRRQYKIQEVIKRRQIMLVQVVKEERGTKGAALTTYLSLAGRYSVLMPNTARGGGISRKITSPQDRNRLKEIAHDLEVPEGMGVILRTAGAMRTKTEIKRDFEYLLRMWEQVRDLTLKSTAPTLVYEEGSVIKRAIRDLYNKDIDEVIVAGEEAHREAKDFMRMLMPSHAKNVKLYTENQPLLSRYSVESQLEGMFSPIVQLRSGGYVVLNQTEALVAIDVNSGRATREHHIEDTALKTNLEAAEEIARQLRLRDLAGLIVIDFIDMDEKRNNRAVERRLKECLKSDRARIQVGHVSHFGLLEMSRQRIRTSVFESSTEKCPHCAGTGHVRSVASVALQCLRMLEESLMRGATHNIAVRTGSEVALYMLNQKRGHLRDLEQRFRIVITIRADGAPSVQQAFAIEKGEQVHSLEQARALAAHPAILVPAGSAEEDEFESDAELEGADIVVAADELGEDGERGENGGRRRRRRRRRGRRDERGETELIADEAAAEHAAVLDERNGGEGAELEAPAAAHAGELHAEDEASDTAASAETRRRRRRGRRGGRRNRRPESEATELLAVTDETAELAEQERIEASIEAGETLFDFGEIARESQNAVLASAVGSEETAAENGAPPEFTGAGGVSPSDAPSAAVEAPSPTDEQLDLAEARFAEREAQPDTAEVFNERVEGELFSPSSRIEEPVAAVAPPATEPTGPDAAVTAQRRSTVREAAVRSSENGGAEPAVPAPAMPDESASRADEPAPAEAASMEAMDDANATVDQPTSRRTGWWSRRIMGSNKG